MGYNGWKNKETWLVNLWYGDAFDMYREEGESITADFIEHFVDEHVAEVLTAPLSHFVQDMLNCALCEIDYHELADHYVEELEDA